MQVFINDNPRELGKAAGELGAKFIRTAIHQNGEANVVLATGSSQFETLNQLINERDINWSKVTMFHLDEYIGLPITHKASFRKYLIERFLNKVPALKCFHLINGEADPREETNRLGELISKLSIDVAFVGIGENGHLAFNDPPADFDTIKPYIIADLDRMCRQQQVNEAWFDSLEEVPTQAISMSVRQIMLSEYVICSIPDERKARAVKNSIKGQVSRMYPASILQRHPNCTYFLDKLSASLLQL